MKKPKQPLRAPLAKDVRKAAKKKGLGLEALLASLKEERRRYNREAYGG